MNGIHILYIEDNPGDVLLVEQMVAECRSGPVVLDAQEDLKSGIQALQANRYDFILLDLNLPDSSGLDTLREVVPHAGQTPIIVFTGQNALDMGLEALQAGAEDFLEKGDLTAATLLKSITFSRERLASRSALKRLSLIAEKTDDMIVVIDPEGKIEYVNPAFCDTTGYQEEEVMGQSMDLLKSGKHAEEFYDDIWAKLRSGKTYRGEVINKDKKGLLFHEDKTITPLFDDHGRVINYIEISKDVTDRALYEDALKQSREEYRHLSEQLQEANNLKELLFDIVTHDLKNPTGAILGMSEHLSTHARHEKDQAIGRSIHEAANALMNTISRTKSLAQSAMGEAVEIETIDLHDMAAEILSVYTRSTDVSGMTFENKIPEGMTVDANPVIDEVISNYVSNALKYAREGGYLGIHAHQSQGSIVICVCDHGEVIPEAHRQDIFKRSVQLDAAQKRGRGLGLAIAERIARAHHGRAWVEPNRPRGNCFCLQLPQQD